MGIGPGLQRLRVKITLAQSKRWAAQILNLPEKLQMSIQTYVASRGDVIVCLGSHPVTQIEELKAQ